MNERMDLHPKCRKVWDRGLTDYPIEEHVRDCNRCQNYQQTEETFRENNRP